MTLPTKPPTTFDWTIYADATFAGLSVLIPVPMLDLAFMWLFRRRIPNTIAKRHGRLLDTAVVDELTRGPGCWQSCLTWPISFTWGFIKRLSRKILYFLTVKEAIDKLSYFWHRAFLIEYALLRGDLDNLENARVTAVALDQVLNSITTSPLIPLARQIISGPFRIWRTLRLARRGREDEMVMKTRSLMAQTWDNFSDYFADVAARYDRVHDEVTAQGTAQIAEAQGAAQRAAQLAAEKEAQIGEAEDSPS